MKEHPEDVCECGDYRKQHPEGGACALNGLGHGVPMPEGACLKFRLAYSYWANYDPYDEYYETEPDFEDHEGDREDWGCCLGDKCLMPSYDHRASECYNVETAEAWAEEAAKNLPQIYHNDELTGTYHDRLKSAMKPITENMPDGE